MEAQVEALLTAINECTPVNFQPCDVSKEIQSLILGKSYGFHDIPNECLASSKMTSCAFNTFIQSLPSAWSLPGTFEGIKKHNSAKTWQRPTISPKFMPDQPLVHYRKTEKLILRSVQKHTDERNLLNASQFGF
jgi:hypothetical protein